jgi:uncharacterized repeat protein (TIGR01451 family)
MNTASGRRPVRSAPVLAAVALLIWASATPAAALELTTPYPVVVVEPGQDVSLDLDIRSPSRERVRLGVGQLPKGWRAFLRGGGHRVSAVYAGAGADTPDVKLQIQVPERARKGSHRLMVTGRGPSGTATLPIELRVVRQAPGAYDLAVEFPQLRGSTTDTFRFDATLQNHTAQQARFALAAEGPKGWKLQARPSLEEQAATVGVDPNGEATIQVEADPPEEVKAGSYPVLLRATGQGTTLEHKLLVEIAGSPALTLQTADERLNTSGGAGDTTAVQLVVRNTGSAPLQNVRLSASPPSGWDVSFQPDTLTSIPPGEEARATARIRPAGEAIAGDYSVTLNADGQNVKDSVDLRFAVKTTAWWGVGGIGIIAAAVAGLLWSFRRFGRR